MPNLFDMLKGGLGVFGGPGLPGQMAGAAMMQASGPGSSEMQALGAGIQAGLQTRHSLQEEQRLREGRLGVEMMLADVGYDRAGLQRAFAMSLGSGDVEGARMLSELIKSLPEAQTRTRNLQAKEALNPETGKVEWAHFDPATGSMSFIGVQAAPEEIAEYVEYDPLSETGWSRVSIIDGQKIKHGPAAGPGGSGAGGSAVERTNAQLAGTAAYANSQLTDLDEGLADGWTALFNWSQDQGHLVAALGRGSFSPEIQAAWTAAQNFINPVVRYFSGAQMTENEARRYVGALLPLPNEDISVVRQKREYRERLVQAMNGGASASDLRALEKDYPALMGSGYSPEVDLMFRSIGDAAGDYSSDSAGAGYAGSREDRDAFFFGGTNR